MNIAIDTVDKKILAELDKNSRQPNSTIAKKLRISRERVDYRIKQMVKSGIINKFPTVINPTKFGYSMFKLYFQFQNLTPEKEKELIKWLVDNPYVQWVTSCKGRWDMNIIVFAHDAEHFSSVMQEFYNKYGEFIFSQNFNVSLAAGNMQKGWILKEKNYYSKVVYTANEREDLGLDRTDMELLKIIANNARMSVVEIASRMKSTPRIISHRVKKLEEMAVVKGYTVSLNYNLLKKQFYKVIFYITMMDDKLHSKLIEYCRTRNNMPYFIFCVGEWSFEVEYVVDDINEFYEAVDDIKKYFPEIKRYESILLAKEHKFDYIPLCYKPKV